MAIPEQGRLEELPLPRLLLDLHRARFEGTLELRRERLQKSFLFQEGVPVFAESNLASETLGVQLMDAGQAHARGPRARLAPRRPSSAARKARRCSTSA